MKLISFIHDDEPTFGIVDQDEVIDLKPLFNGKINSLKALIEQNLVNSVPAMAQTARSRLKLADLVLQPVIPDPGKIFCIGLNYAEHVRETQKEITEAPTVFVRFPESQVAHLGNIQLPAESDKLDYEGEIAIVIGQGGRRIKEENAWGHIAGYACYNDGSIRDWQTATSQWTPGKNFWQTGGFGPWLVTADEIKPDQTMTLTTRLNGVEMQRATTDMLIHSIPRQIAYISTFLPLNPGDVIVTGTPGGVGAKRKPAIFMKEGDVVEIEVDAIGVLRNTVARETT